MLIIKQSLKLLNSFLEFGYYQSVLLFRFSKQIARAIVVFYSVVMMDFPTFGKRFIVVCFPNKDMLKDIAVIVSSRILWLQDKNVTALRSISPAFPEWMFFSLSLFIRTGLAKFRPFAHWLPANGASNLWVLEFVRMRKVIKSGLLLPFKRTAIFSRRLVVTLLNTMRAKVHMSTCLGKNFSAITTFNINHLTNNYITTIAMGSSCE